MLLLRLATRLPRRPTRLSRNVAGPVGYMAFLGWREFVPAPAESFRLRHTKNPFGGSKRLLFPGQRPNTKRQPGCRLVYSDLSAKQQSRAAPEYRESLGATMSIETSGLNSKVDSDTCAGLLVSLITVGMMN